MEPNYDNLDNDRLYRAAEWFAGYAVIRWHLGYTLGDVTINEDGTGEWQRPKELPLYPRDRLPPGVRGLAVNDYGVLTSEEFAKVLSANDDESPYDDEPSLPTPEPYVLQVPTPHHHALMYLSCWYWEHWLSLPLSINPLEWPERCLEEVWHWLTFEYCLTAFDHPMTREEALAFCVEEVKDVHEQYAYLQEGLVEELCARLTVSGEEITAYMNEWRDATEFYDRQDAAAEAGVVEPCGHSPLSLRWCADGQHECRRCEFEVERQGWYEEDRQRAQAGERLDCGHVPTDQVYGDDGGFWCRVCRPHGYDDAT